MHDDATLPGDDTAQISRVDYPTPRHLERGNRLGRYTVLDLLGQGGMGQVYAAYDPQLDRRVAVKVLRTMGSGPSNDIARQRLLREAQAMARLSHPHVVTVHDVGTVEDEVFVAMEFVDGPTLGAWLQERPRSTAEIIEVFAEAGRGLAAAHGAGLVHRDFKPANVLIDGRGRAKVTDFGLVRADDVEDDERRELLHSGPASSSLGPTLTLGAGAIGTPAYMAPEQHAHGEIDARADQFGFCVALYDALFEQHPFGADSLMGLVSAVSQGKRREVPSGTTVPAHVRRAVLRGLEHDPEDRWPDMHALLDVLVDDPAQRRRRWGLGIAGVGVLGALVVLAVRPRPPAPEPPAPCEGSGAEMDRTWSPERHDAIAEAFAATGQAHAPGLWDRSAAVIDDYARRWTISARDACEATRVRGEQSDSLFDRRRACLDRRLDDLEARLGVLAEVDDALLDKSFELATGLTPVEICDDTERLMQTVPPPEDPDVARQVEEQNRALSVLSVQIEAGHAARVADEAKAILEHSIELGHAPLRARARSLVSLVEEDLGQLERSEELRRLAIVDAAEGRDDYQLAKTWAKMPFLVGFLRGRTDDAELLSVAARAALARAGRPAELAKLYEHGMGSTYLLAGDNARAESHYREALHLAGQSDDNAPFRARLLNNLAVLRMNAGLYEEARDLFERSLATQRDLLRPDDLSLGELQQNLSSIAFYLGDPPEALRHIDAGLRIAIAAQPSPGPQRLTMRLNRAVILRELGRLDEARSDIDEATRMAAKIWRDDNPNRTALLSNRAWIELDEGQAAKARRTLEAAVELATETLGEEHPARAQLLGQRGMAEHIDGDLEAARASLEQATQIFEQIQGPDHPQLAELLRWQGDVLRASGARARAAETYHRAVTIFERRPGSRRELARARFGLARTLPAAEREQARMLATKARERLAADGLDDEVAELDAWTTSSSNAAR